MNRSLARTRKASFWTLSLVGGSALVGLIGGQFLPNRAPVSAKAEHAIAAMLAAKAAQNAGPDDAYTVDLRPTPAPLIVDMRNTYLTTALISPQQATGLSEADKSIAESQGPIIVLPPEQMETSSVGHNAPAIALMVPNGVDPITEIPDVGCNLPGPKSPSCGGQKKASATAEPSVKSARKAQKRDEGGIPSPFDTPGL